MDKYFTLTYGDSKKTPVVCLHGLLGSARNLTRLCEAIAAEGFFVVAYDQRGHGRSPHFLSDADYSIPNFAQDVFGIFDRFGFETAHLVGHSMGARIALCAHTLNAKRLRSLSMLDAGVLIEAGALKSLHAIIDPLPEGFADKSEAQLFFKRFEPGLQAFLSSNLRERNGGLQWVFDLKHVRSALLQRIHFDQNDAWRAVKIPTLLLRGERSDYFSQGQFEKMLRENPHAIGQVIPRSGHWLHAENLEDTKGCLLKFLGQFQKMESS